MAGCHGLRRRRAAGVGIGAATHPVQHVGAEHPATTCARCVGWLTLIAMATPDPRASAQAALPDVVVRAAGVFGVQDRALAIGLLGQDRVRALLEPLVAADPPVRATQSFTGRAAAAVEAVRPWVPVPVLVALSDTAFHVCDWDRDTGAAQERSRLLVATTAATVEEYGTARRLTLADALTGYRLPLTSTVSPLSAVGSGVKSVLAALPAGRPSHPAVG